MISSIVLMIGSIIVFIWFVLLFKRLTLFLISVYWGTVINFRYVDRDGATHVRRVHCDNTDELVALLRELKEKNREAAE